MPASKVMTFNRSDGFRLNARYAQLDQLPGGTDLDIGTFVIPTIPAPADASETPRIKLKIKLDLSGLFFVESATMVETVYEVEEKPASPAPAEGAAAPAAGDEKPAAAEGAPAAAAAAEPEKKKKIRNTPISFQSTLFGQVDTAKIQSFYEQEGRMAAQDRLLIETSERKNDVRISNRARAGWLSCASLSFMHSFTRSLTHLHIHDIRSRHMCTRCEERFRTAATCTCSHRPRCAKTLPSC